MFNWIREEIEIDFEIPQDIKYLIEEAEEADINRSAEYDCIVDAIDVACKRYYTAGKMTQSQWDIMVDKYHYS